MNFGTWDQRELHLTGAATAMCVCVLIYLPGIVEEGIHYFDDLAEFMAIVVAVVFMFFAVLFRHDKWTSLLILLGGVNLYSAIRCLAVDFTQSMMFFQLVLMDLISLIGLISLVFLSRGFMHNVTRQIMINLGQIACLLIPWAITRYVMRDYVGARTVLWETMPMILFYLAGISYLARPEIRDVSPSEELKVRLARVESSYTMDPRCYMPLRDLVMILGFTDYGWTYHESGPIEKECRGKIIGETKRHWVVTVKKWRSEDFCRVVISPEEHSRGSWGLRFELMHYHFTQLNDKGFVRIYGNDGFFIDMFTEDPRIYENNAVSMGLDKLLRKF